MGYSIHTPCKSKRARDEMVAFLKKHYRPFSVLAAGSGCLSEVADQEDLDNREWTHTDSLRGPLGDDLSYIPDDTKWYIGFDFGTSGGGQGTWMKDVCRWIATKVGHRRTFHDIEGQVPYIVYDIPNDAQDRDSIWPVLERSEYDVTKDLESLVTDRGFRGWAQQVRQMRAHSKRVTKERCDQEGGTKAMFEARWADRSAFWKLQMRIAKRADKYIKAELVRLDELWENR